jgi:hypothetical protein
MIMADNYFMDVEWDPQVQNSQVQAAVNQPKKTSSTWMLNKV